MRAKQPYYKQQKRLGRGRGSGRGKTAGRGTKGQKSRSGAHRRPGFEGGQTPLIRRLPKRGFNRGGLHTRYSIINVDTLAQLDLKEISPDVLQERGIVKSLGHGLKVLGRGKIDKALTVRAHRFSKQAKQIIEAAGGQAQLISPKGTKRNVSSAR